MIRTLWLASWYPSKSSLQSGDFIQRHAQAVSRFAKVHVVYVVPLKKTHKKIATSIVETGTLTEEIVYYKKRNESHLSRGLSFIRYFRLYRKHIRYYIKNYGKPEIVHVHVCMRAGLFALWLKKRYDIPYMITEHSTIYTIEEHPNFYEKNFVFRHFATKVFKHASVVLPVSNNLGNNIQRMVVNVPFIKVANVVSDQFSYKEKNNNRPFVFLHVSSLQEYKNPKGIMRAFKSLLDREENVLLKMVGKNCDELIAYAKALTIPKNQIIFTGEISNEAVADEMKDADAFILFSKSESFGCVVVESLCCGNPVIATNVGGVAEQLNENNSIVIAANDEQALLKAMKHMVENYADYNRKEIAEKAMALYNYSTIGKQITGIYEKVLHK